MRLKEEGAVAPGEDLTKLFLKRRLVWAVLLVLAAAAAIIFFGNRLATRAYFDEAMLRGQTTLRLAVAALRGHINRFEPLPALIADHDDIKELVSQPEDAARRARANEYLKEINTLLQSSDIYVMLPDGDTIAASNFDQEATFVGENFAYRPYFKDAIAGNRGRFFAIGTTSLKRGYFFSSPILVGSEIRGVVVFKVETDCDRGVVARRRKRDLPHRSRRHHLHDRPDGLALHGPPAAHAGSGSLVPGSHAATLMRN